MRALGCLIIIFSITAGLWYWVISSISDDLARVVVVQYEETQNLLPLNSFHITSRRANAFTAEKTFFGKKDIASRETVTLGRVLPNGYVEVLDGLDEDDTVIKRTSQHLKNRTRIEIVDDPNTRL